MSRVKVIICFMLAVLLLSSGVAAASAAPPEVSAASAVLYCPESDTILYEKNGYDKVPVAFLAKVVTALIVIDNLELDETVTVTAEYNRGIIGLSAMNYSIGESVPVRDLLYAMFVHSANEAANILACAVSGSVDSFIPLMNEKAAALGTSDTYFTNTHGVNDNLSYTTAADAVKILADFISHESLMEIADTTFYSAQATDKFGVRNMYSSNVLITQSSAQYNPLCHGIKDDRDSVFGYSLGTYAADNGTSIVGVVFGSSYDQDTGALSYPDMNTLINWAFDNYSITEILQKDIPCKEIDLKLCKKSDKMVITPADGFSYVLPTDYDESLLDIEYDVPESINAPVEQGAQMGEAVISYDGQEIGRVPVVAATTAELDNMMYYTWKVTSFFDSALVKICVVVCILLFVLYIIYVISFNRRRKKAYRSVNTKKYRR